MGKVERKTNPGVIGDGPDERIPGVTSKDECGLGNGCNGIFHVGDPCSPSRSTVVGMLDKCEKEEQTESGATGTLAQEELCASTRTPDDSNIENYNNYHCSIVPSVTIDADVDEGEVDEDPPTRSKYDQINKDESTTIMEVIAGTDVKKKDDTVVIATEGSYLLPYKALLRAGDFVFTGQPPGG